MKVAMTVQNVETGECSELQEEAESYEEAREALRGRLEQGWRILHWTTDRLSHLPPLLER